MDSSAGSCQPSRDGGQVIPYDRATFGRSLPQDMTVPRLDRVTCPPPQERIIGGGKEGKDTSDVDCQARYESETWKSNHKIYLRDSL